MFLTPEWIIAGGVSVLFIVGYAWLQRREYEKQRRMREEWYRRFGNHHDPDH